MTGSEEKKRLTALEKRVKRQVKARRHLFFAVCQPGFEHTAMRELSLLGIEEFEGAAEGGVEFYGSLEDCYRISMLSRTIIRVIMRISRFRAESFTRLNDIMAKIPWELYLCTGTTVSFNVSCRKSRLYHSGAVEQEARAAVERRAAEQGLALSFTAEAAQEIFLRLDHDRCQVSLDATGEALYKRGNKRLVTPASLRETTAALILREAAVTGYDVLIDPMCGSGTFSLEGAGIAQNLPASPDRDFSFMRWPAFSKGAYAYVKKNLEQAVAEDPRPGRIIVSDNDPEAVEAARANFASAGLAETCAPETRDFFTERIDIPPDRRCLIVLNPPYGKRLNSVNVADVYRKIGQTMREWYGRCGYAVIVPGLELEKVLSLPHDRKVLFMNGGIRVAVIFRDVRPFPG
ncbi:MAG TPA: hypothetical protein PK926_00750 [Spirochaetota bacterium]|nr:hypothetical protein [Spirochaetota bacterium]HPI87879.1 hypothetical protein [Spirochaetota bacterium]HPR47389.1 hypothetical protein [Spirochaetota bacterium]